MEVMEINFLFHRLLELCVLETTVMGQVVCLLEKVKRKELNGLVFADGLFKIKPGRVGVVQFCIYRENSEETHHIALVFEVWLT